MPNNNKNPLPPFDDRAPHSRYCDLVLTGGVTSAVAYPAAVFALATAYRFNSIGGSSSGAGIAALAAAAEYRRRHGSSDGFRILLERTAALKEKVDGQTRLAWLFQPAPGNERLFKLLVPVLAAEAKVTAFLRGLLRCYRVPMGIGAAGALAFVWAVSHWWPQGVLAYLATAFIVAVAAAGISLWCDASCGLVDGDYGLCSGLKRRPDARHPALVEWLHELIQEIAGRRKDIDVAPLTFADLAAAPGSPRETLNDHGPQSTVSINLQMFSSNVTHGRPVLLPRPKEGTPLYFRPRELLRLFPAEVVEHMQRHSAPYVGRVKLVEPPRRARGWWCPTPKDVPSWQADAQHDSLWELPKDDLPIVVAARMSVSFPVLFSAVPVWAIDNEVEPAVFRRCLLSDGGLCSNFPIHLFDSPIPAWPTFGISLHRSRGNKQRGKDDIWLPSERRTGPDGRDDRWSRFDDRAGGTERLFGFIGALLSTTQDWNDAALARMPGVRDRVVRVGLDQGEGGLNIRMDDTQIDALAKKGEQAARMLLDRFAKPSTPGGAAQGWNEHRWVRFNVFRDSLVRGLAGAGWSASNARHAQPLSEQIAAAIDAPPLRGDARSQLLPAQAAALDGLLAALSQAERALTAQPVWQPYTPVPPPVLRVRPTL
jgi:predicted acylesterase/phospholipase RssA